MNLISYIEEIWETNHWCRQALACLEVDAHQHEFRGEEPRSVVSLGAQEDHTAEYS